MIFIRDGTRVYRLLMLLACVGEYPMQSVCLLGNDRIGAMQKSASKKMLPTIFWSRSFLANSLNES